MGKISKNDKILIENLRKEKQWGARKMLKEFPAKNGLLVNLRAWSDRPI